MKMVPVILLLSVMAALPAIAGSGEKARATCDTFELNGFHQEYDAAVCAGLSRLQNGDPQGAVEFFEEALKFHLFEIPNYDLLPRLAVALHRSGQKERARRTLQMAELALQVEIGISQCEAIDTGYRLIARDPEKFGPAMREDVSMMVCGGMYESYYGLDDLSKLKFMRSELQFYFDAEDEILGTVD